MCVCVWGGGGGGGQNESGLWTFTEDVFVGWMGCSCDVFVVLINSLY